jgi:hypothetical protein
MGRDEGRSVPIHLALIPRRDHLDDFVRIAELVRAEDPAVRPVILEDRRSRLRQLLLARRPTFLFAIGPLQRFEPLRGCVRAAHSIPKSEECAALERAGIPVPRWALLTADEAPDLSEFGPYVVVKPDASGRGADVKVYRRNRVRWKPRATGIGRKEGNDDRIVQEFIYTGPCPTSYRVVTLFGTSLVAYRIDADRNRPGLPSRYGFGDVGSAQPTIVSNSRGCRIVLDSDPDVIKLAELAHAALPDHPLLGVDIVRDADTGTLYVLELNTIGWTWHLSTRDARRIARETGGDPYAQMNGLERAACVLARKARELAR